MKRSWVGDYISNGWIRKCEWRLHACSVSRLGNIPAATRPKPTHHQIKCIRFFYSLCIDWKSFHFLFCVLCFACTIVQCILCMYIVIDPCNWIIYSLFFPNTREDRSQVICPGGQCPDLLQSVNRAVWPLLCSCVNQGFDLSYLPPILPNWRNCYCKLPFRKLMGTAS